MPYAYAIGGSPEKPIGPILCTPVPGGWVLKGEGWQERTCAADPFPQRMAATPEEALVLALRVIESSRNRYA